MSRRTPALRLTAMTREHLESIIATAALPASVRTACRVILFANAGLSNRSIARSVGLSAPTVAAIRARFERGGVNALIEQQPRVRPAKVLTPELMQRIVDCTLAMEPGGLAGWTTRGLATHLKTSRMTVHRAWQQLEIQPKHVRQLTELSEPVFATTVRDIAGIYLHPQRRVLVLETNTKQEQASPGRPAASLFRKPENKSSIHWADNFFVALHDQVRDRTFPETEEEFLAFLTQVDRVVHRENWLYVLATTTTPGPDITLQRWVASRHQQDALILKAPTGEYWMKQVSYFFRVITQLQRHVGVIPAARDLPYAITLWLARPPLEPFIWVANHSPGLLGEFHNRCKD